MDNYPPGFDKNILEEDEIVIPEDEDDMDDEYDEDEDELSKLN